MRQKHVQRSVTAEAVLSKVAGCSPVNTGQKAFADVASWLKRYGQRVYGARAHLGMQGAFRKVAVEANACAKELTATLKKRMLLHKEEAAECIQMLRKLGEPVEALQVGR